MALLGNVLNAKGPNTGSDLADFLASLSVAAAAANTTPTGAVQFDAFVKAILVSARDNTNLLGQAAFGLLNTLRYPTNLTLAAIGVAVAPITLIAAGFADAFTLGRDGVQTAFTSVAKLLGLAPEQTPAVPTAVASSEYTMKMVTYLSSVPGSANTPLAQEFATLQMDSNTLAQSTHHSRQPDLAHGVAHPNSAIGWQPTSSSRRSR